MERSPKAGRWSELRSHFHGAAAFRSWSIEANDGVIATAGLLFGFAGAGASNRVLLFTAAAATIAGGLSVGGASWAEQAAERDAQLLHTEQERHDLATDPEGELEELTRHWEDRGLRPDTAAEVARQLTEHDALAAQLEWEYEFDEPMPASFPVSFALGAGLAYMAGAVVPLLITYFAPVDVEPRAILVAVVVALVLSSLVAARAGELTPRRMLARTLVVGVLTMVVSYLAGELLL
ncbi:VIT1/CCC1 transporter family protein [Aquihabitans sp. McL0605]|uniref:VIT1/CCC1 transporter family protein n=1 Tax=Aquihabitans sp. McL0605 TaxID=3415671 RepID=UPI003CF1E5EA